MAYTNVVQSGFIVNEGAGILNKGEANKKISVAAHQGAQAALSDANSNMQFIGVAPSYTPVVITWHDPVSKKDFEFSGIKKAGDQNPVELYSMYERQKDRYGNEKVAPVDMKFNNAAPVIIHFDKAAGPNKGKPDHASADFLANYANGLPTKPLDAKLDHTAMVPVADYVKSVMDKAQDGASKPQVHHHAKLHASLQSAKNDVGVLAGLSMNDTSGPQGRALTGAKAPSTKTEIS